MQNIPPYGGGVGTQQGYAAPVDPYDMLEGGKRAIKFVQKDANGFDQHAPVGTSYTGLIVGDLRTMQITDFETKQPKVYPDGRPAMQLVLDLQTDERDPDDPTDDGVRTLYVKNQMLAAFQQGIQPTKHLGRIGEGSRVTVTLVGYKNTGKGNPQKLYQIQIGPEFVPYVDPAQRQANQAVYGEQVVQTGFQQAVQAGFPPAAQMQQPQYATPAAPAFPGQVVPAAPIAQSVSQPVAPQPVAQPVAQPVSPALAALNEITADHAALAPAPASAAPANGVDEGTMNAYSTLIGNGIDPHTAINSLAQRLAPGNEAAFIAQLSAAVGVQPVQA